MTDPSFAESIATLLRLEREERLFDARFRGFSPWRVMRSTVFGARSPFGRAPAMSNGRRLARALAGTVRLIAILLAGRQRDYLVKTCVSGLRLRRGARWLDTYYDAWLQGGIDHFKLEELNSLDFEPQRKAALLPRHLDPIVFTFWGKLLSELFPVRLRDFPERVSTLLRERASLDISPARLRQRVSSAIWQARLYGLLLRRLKPRAVLVSDTAEYGLILAASQRGIPFVELQHGVFDEHHADAVPAEVEGSKAELLLPDVYASLGRFWLDHLKNTRQGRGSATPVGNSVVDEARALRAARQLKGEHSIVVTSQGHVPVELADWLGAAIAAAPKGLDWRMWIKLHPLYDAADGGPLRRLAEDPRVTLIPGASEPNVYELLAAADLHLSVSSLCHFDAAALGVRSLIIPLAEHEQILYAVEGDLVHLAENPAATWPMLAQGRLAPREGDYYCEDGFVANLDRLAGTLA